MTNSRVPTLTFLLVAIFSTSHLFAQSGETPSVPDLRSETNRVLIDISVTAKGHPVHGIDKLRFHVFEDGKEQQLRSFEEQQTETVVTPILAPKPLPPNIYNNTPQYPPATSVNVLLLDGLNTPVRDQVEVRTQMVSFLKQISPGTPLALFTLSSNLQLVLGFTQDPASVVKAINSPQGVVRPSVVLGSSLEQSDHSGELRAAPGGLVMQESATQGLRQFEADNTSFQTDVRVKLTLQAMRELARYLSGIPGRKNVIWFSASFPIAIVPDPNAAPLFDPFSVMREYQDEVRETSAVLGGARVAVYPIDARGLLGLPSLNADHSHVSEEMSYSPGRKENIGEASEQFVSEMANSHETMRQMARETGGQSFLNTNDFGQAFKQAIRHGANYYTISFAPASKLKDGAYHRIQVKVEGGPYDISYRAGYFSKEFQQPSVAKSGHIMEATVHGAPPSTQVLFESRVLPANAPDIMSGPKLVDEPAGSLARSLKPPVKRYVLDTLVDAHTLRCDADSDRTRQCQLEVTAIGYGADGKRLNFVDRGLALRFSPELYNQRLETGIPVRIVIDLPIGQVFLRIAVRDIAGARIGSMEIPLQIVGS